MRRFSNLADLKQIKDDPDLYREIFSFLSFCVAEILEYGDAEDLDGHDFNVVLLTDTDRDYLTGLGQPEEDATTVLKSQGQKRVFRRLVYPAEIIFTEEK